MLETVKQIRGICVHHPIVAFETRLRQSDTEVDHEFAQSVQSKLMRDFLDPSLNKLDLAA